MVTVSGLVADLTIFYTRAGDPLGFATLTDGDVRVEVLIFRTGLGRAGLL